MHRKLKMETFALCQMIASVGRHLRLPTQREKVQRHRRMNKFPTFPRPQRRLRQNRTARRSKLHNLFYCLVF